MTNQPQTPKHAQGKSRAQVKAEQKEQSEKREAVERAKAEILPDQVRSEDLDEPRFEKVSDVLPSSEAICRVTVVGQVVVYRAPITLNYTPQLGHKLNVGGSAYSIQEITHNAVDGNLLLCCAGWEATSIEYADQVMKGWKRDA